VAPDPGARVSEQGSPSPGSLRGRLLVANPRLPDPNFDRTVVLLLAHGPDGALGVVLNRPTESPVADALPGWEDLASPPAVLFVGGPVELTSIICLIRQDDDGPRPGAAWSNVREGVGTFDLDLGPEAATGVSGLRIFAGYAGWGPGQLEGEIEQGGWFVLDAEAGDATSASPATLWRDVLRRQPSAMKYVAAYPGDPADN
jgi:putative transcriptional regulator